MTDDGDEPLIPMNLGILPVPGMSDLFKYYIVEENFLAKASSSNSSASTCCIKLIVLRDAFVIPTTMGS